MNINDQKSNYYSIIVIMIITIILTVFGSGANNAGMSIYELLFVPIGIALITSILYYFSRKITSRNNWIITVFGIILMLVFGIRTFFNM